MPHTRGASKRLRDCSESVSCSEPRDCNCPATQRAAEPTVAAANTDCRRNNFQNIACRHGHRSKQKRRHTLRSKIEANRYPFLRRGAAPACPTGRGRATS